VETLGEFDTGDDVTDSGKAEQDVTVHVKKRKKELHRKNKPPENKTLQRIAQELANGTTCVSASPHTLRRHDVENDEIPAATSQCVRGQHCLGYAVCCHALFLRNWPAQLHCVA
jgi:hypothetical protein